MGFEEPGAVQHVGHQLAPVEGALHDLAVIVVARIAADGGEPVGRQGDEAGDGRAAGDVFDMRVEAAVLVDHHDRREGAAARRLHEVAAHPARVAARGIVVHVFGFDPLVGEHDHVRLGVIGQQRLGHGEAGAADHRDRRRAVQELAPGHAGMAVLIVKFEDSRIDILIGVFGLLRKMGVHEFFPPVWNEQTNNARTTDIGR